MTAWGCGSWEPVEGKNWGWFRGVVSALVVDFDDGTFEVDPGQGHRFVYCCPAFWEDVGRCGKALSATATFRPTFSPRPFYILILYFYLETK